MPPVVRCEVEQLGTRIVVHVAGELAVSTAPTVRLALLKCLVDQPDAVLVDLVDLAVREPSALSVFAAMARQAAVFPGTPLLLCAPSTATAALLAGGGYGRLAVFASVPEALAATPQRYLLSITDVLLPISGAVRRARDLATDACVRWDLPHLIGPASLVANELVANAVVHARTMIDMRLVRRPRHLMIVVRDGSVEIPVLSDRAVTQAGGMGLRLVDAVARRWGSLPNDGGKAVWALLDIATHDDRERDPG